MYTFLSGATALSSFVIALFFFRFYRKTKEELFLFFAVAFLVFTIERFLSIDRYHLIDANPIIYCMRIFGFTLISAGVIRKNRLSSNK